MFPSAGFHHNISEVVSVVIDPSKTYQTVLGFGGAFTDSTGININALPERLQDDLIKSYYSEEGQVPRTYSLSVCGVSLQGLSMQSLFCGNCRLFTTVSSSALHFADSSRTICFGFPWFQNIKKSANYNQTQHVFLIGRKKRYLGKLPAHRECRYFKTIKCQGHQSWNVI